MIIFFEKKLFSGVAALSRSIRESTVLTRLDLSGNSIGENGATETSRNSSFALAGAAHLAKMLQQNTVLTRLDIRHNAISSGSSYLAGQSPHAATFSFFFFFKKMSEDFFPPHIS